MGGGGGARASPRRRAPRREEGGSRWANAGAPRGATTPGPSRARERGSARDARRRRGRTNGATGRAREDERPLGNRNAPASCVRAGVGRKRFSQLARSARSDFFGARTTRPNTPRPMNNTPLGFGRGCPLHCRVAPSAARRDGLVRASRAPLPARLPGAPGGSRLARARARGPRRAFGRRRRPRILPGVVVVGGVAPRVRANRAPRRRVRPPGVRVRVRGVSSRGFPPGGPSAPAPYALGDETRPVITVGFLSSGDSYFGSRSSASSKPRSRTR